MARAAAYLLVQSLRPDYEPPADLEIVFDARSRAAAGEEVEEVALAADIEGP